MTKIPIDVVDLNTTRALPQHPGRNIIDMPPDIQALPPTVISIDPGETTGWSLIQVSDAALRAREPIHTNILLFQHGQVDCGRTQGSLELDEFAGDEAILNVNPGRNPGGEALGVVRLMQVIDQNPGAAVVIENFILDFRKANKSAASLSPVRVTARLEQELWHRNRVAFRQLPSLAKTTMPDERLKEFQLYLRAGGQEHARDADRHSLTFLRRCQIDPALRYMAWPHLFDPPVIEKVKPKKRSPKAPGPIITLPVD